MNKSIKKIAAMLLAAVLLLSGCTQQEPPPGEEPTVTLTIAAGDAQDTLEPAYSTAAGGETILFHLYENLMRWENDGSGYATLAPGQAASYTVETDYAGNATYTFTLRDDIVWSDGQSVTAYQFVDAWQRLADPAYHSPHHALMSCISGYEEVRTTGDSSLLAVSAPDAHTFVVVLNGSAPYFLEMVCASAYTMPIRTYLPDNEEGQFITNGAYTVSGFSSQLVELAKSGTYYDAAGVTMDTLRFVPTTGSDADHEKLMNGQLDFTVDIPLAELEQLAANEYWTPEPVTSTYGLVINTRQAPFDNADVRSAFRLVIDEQAIVDALGDYVSRPATGLIPYGVTDYGVRSTEEEAEGQAEEGTSPDPNAPQPKPQLGVPTYWDFRAHSEEIVTLDIGGDYAADCTHARTLLAGAGYAGGNGFPAVEYIYVDTAENRLIAKLLQSDWQSKLGVTVTLRALTAEEYELMLHPTVDAESGEEVAAPAFQIAAMEFTASRNDAGALLSRWHSGSAANYAGYASPAFDILLSAADAAVAPETYDAYLHDAEAILMEDAPVIPVFYRGGSYALAEGLEGLYRAPNGIYFFANVTKTVE